MKQIETLAKDIEELLKDSNHLEPSPESLEFLGTNMGSHMISSLGERTKGREVGKMWASDIGEGCPRKTWYKWNEADKGEGFGPGVKVKFLYGNLIEEMILFLAKQAGHEVTCEQERVEYVTKSNWLVSGRIDACIDGTLLDVKSCSSYAFKKYTKEGITAANDDFGYRWQLGFYAMMKPEYHKHGFLFIDKSLGHIAFVPVIPPSPEEVSARISSHIDSILHPTETHVVRGYDPVPDGKSGNYKLAIPCSYCSFKHTCYPNVRTFLYANGPKFLTTVKETPRVLEVTSGA